MPDSTIALSLWESVNQELKNLFPNDLYDMWFEGLVCTEESDAFPLCNFDKSMFFNFIFV